MNANPIDDYTERIICSKAKQLVGVAGFTDSDRADIEQELTIVLLKRLPKFDAKKAQRRTFIVRLIDRKVVDLIRHRKAEKRDPMREECSLNERLSNGMGGTVAVVDTLSKTDLLRRSQKEVVSENDLTCMKLDLATVIASLPPELRDLCERLKTCTVAEISRQTGVPPSTLRSRIKRIRQRFQNAGLEDYLDTSVVVL